MPALISILAAATGGAGHEPSKVAFYVCGGLLVAWALTVSGIGMSNADFPSTAMAKRGTMVLSVVLVLAAAVTAVITA
jgi:hypothetical protein